MMLVVFSSLMILWGGGPCGPLRSPGVLHPSQQWDGEEPMAQLNSLGVSACPEEQHTLPQKLHYQSLLAQAGLAAAMEAPPEAGGGILYCTQSASWNRW